MIGSRLGRARGQRAVSALLIAIVVAVVLTASACGGSSTRGRSANTTSGAWKLVDTGWPQPGARLHTITFADPTHGFALGWTPQQTASSVAHLVATSDGGASWTQVSLPAYHQLAAFNAICSPEPGKAWGVGDLGSIAFTADKGAGWTYVHKMTMGLDLSSVWFVDAGNGWAVGSQMQPTMIPTAYTPVVMHTSDGGKTWQEQTVSPVPRQAAKLWAVRFTDAQHGWAAGGVAAAGQVDPLAGGRGIVLTTVNGGQTWRVHEMPDATGTLLAVSATDARHCWAVGMNGSIVSTRNGGATWIEDDAGQHGAAGTLSAVAFTDAHNGWAGGSNLLLHTSDGGKTWVNQMSGTFDVYALCCPGDGSAWAAGDTRPQGGAAQPAVWHYVAH